MFDMEENSKLLEKLLTKLNKIGESLWHRGKRKKISMFRRTNFR